jgi:hypothetical protein
MLRGLYIIIKPLSGLYFYQEMLVFMEDNQKLYFDDIRVGMEFPPLVTKLTREDIFF